MNANSTFVAARRCAACFRQSVGASRPTWWLLSAVALGACVWGTRPNRFPPALGPQGARVALRVTGESLDRVGELYAVDGEGIVLAESSLMRIRWPRVHALDVDRLDEKFDILAKETVSAEKRERLRLISRFPQGLSGALLDSVLSKRGQRAMEVIASAPAHESLRTGMSSLFAPRRGAPTR